MEEISQNEMVERISFFMGRYASKIIHRWGNQEYYKGEAFGLQRGINKAWRLVEDHALVATDEKTREILFAEAKKILLLKSESR